MRLSLALAVFLVGCVDGNFELSVDVKTDFLPGRQFVGTETEIFREDGEPLDQQRSLATSLDTFLDGARVADFEGLAGGTYRIRVALLTSMGQVLSVQETILELRQNFAVTLLMTSSCRAIQCPAAEPDGDPNLSSCIGGECVDPRCTPQTPEFCQDAGCVSDDQCAAGSSCTTGACIDGFCFVGTDATRCDADFYCDIDEGCVAEPGVITSDAGPLFETRCTDGLDDDGDGDIDCEDADCAEMSCDDGVWCNGADVCRATECVHESAPCERFCNEDARACDECARNADCGEVTRGEWESCGSFGGTCGTNGTQTRRVTTPTCNGGVCSVVVTDASRACTRPSRQGQQCGSFWQRCCGGSCTNLANNRDACGACRVDCGGLACTADNGGYACANCSSNAQCTSIYNGAATCYPAGGNRCNCQCPSNGVCENGGCGAGFFCHDVSGNNYCSPTR